MKSLKQMNDLVQVLFEPRRHDFYIRIKTPLHNHHWVVSTDSRFSLWNACRRLEPVVLRSYSSNKVLYDFTVRSAINEILSNFNLMYLWEK